MEIKLTIKRKFDVKTLKVSAGVRYWEDAKVNGVVDTEGTLIPFRDGDYWCPEIDIETGIIKDWPQGITASLHYKVCDDCQWKLLDENGFVVHDSETNNSCYVPKTLSPKENGFGDYIIMDIGVDGQIGHWKFIASNFSESEE